MHLSCPTATDTGSRMVGELTTFCPQGSDIHLKVVKYPPTQEFVTRRMVRPVGVDINFVISRSAHLDLPLPQPVSVVVGNYYTVY